MTQISTITNRAAFGPPPVSAGYKVDISRGERIGRVSSEWFSRPDDERYLSLGALYAAVRARADRATARTVETRTLRVDARRDTHRSQRVGSNDLHVPEPDEEQDDRQNDQRRQEKLSLVERRPSWCVNDRHF